LGIEFGVSADLFITALEIDRQTEITIDEDPIVPPVSQKGVWRKSLWTAPCLIGWCRTGKRKETVQRLSDAAQCVRIEDMEK
jgi:hypothetical protein